MRCLFAGLGLDHPAADLGVDLVAGAEKLDKVPGISQSDAASLGQLAAFAEPGEERTDLPVQRRVLRGGFEISHEVKSSIASASVSCPRGSGLAADDLAQFG